MYPYFRLLRVFVAARLGATLELGEVGRLRFRVWPPDIDVYPEMNNGRQLTVMDMGRIDLAIRSGLFRLVRRSGWAFAAGGASVRYRRRLRPLHSFVLATDLVGYDERWFYFVQEIQRRELVHTSALVRIGVTSTTGLVPVPRVLEALDAGQWRPELPEWVQRWIEAEDHRVMGSIPPAPP